MNAAYASRKPAAGDQTAATSIARVRFTPALEQNMPVGVYKLALFCWALFLSSFVVTFWGSAHALFMLAICGFYALMFFGTPYVLWRQAKKAMPQSEKRATPLAAFLRRDLATIDGPTHGFDAVVQVILVPAILSLGCMAIGTIISLARAGAY